MFKQKADRNKVVQPPPPPVQNTEIVPGRLNEQNWREIEEILDNEETACEYVEEILKLTLWDAYDVYLRRQLLPYTVSAAKDALLLVVEWNFLHRDESQVSPVLQSGWIPDKEPCRPSIDNWAPGYYITPDEKVEDEIPDDQSLGKLDEETQVSLSASFSKFSLNKSQDASFPQASPAPQPVEEPLLSQEICFLLGSDITKPTVKQMSEHKAKKEKFVKAKQHSHYELLKKASVSRMSETLSQADREEQRRKMDEALQNLDNAPQNGPRLTNHLNFNRGREGRPQGIKDVFFDDEGNVVGVIKLNSDKLPSNRVKIEYQIPERDSGPDKTDKKRIRYKDKLARNTTQSTFQRFHFGRSHKKPFALESEEYCAPPLKSMVESIDPVVGVTVKDIQQTKMGPNPGPTRQLLTECADKLRPITRRVPIPTTDLLEILQPTTTVMSHTSTPLPPIVQQTPTLTGQTEAA